MGWIKEYFDQILAWFRGFFQYLLNLLTAVFFWVWTYVRDFFRPMWEPVINKYNELADYLQIPTSEYFKDLFATADLWLPLTEGFQLATLHGAVVTVLIIVRTVKKFIPTLSG